MKDFNQASDDFTEVQFFRQPWLWVIVLAVSLILIGTSILLLQSAWSSTQDGSKTPSRWLFVGYCGLLLLGVLQPILLYEMRLITRVGSQGILVHFPPLPGQFIPFDQINHCEAREYNALREYGGWGIRFGSGGRAYNVSGRHGVQLEFANGQRLLIGSQHNDELVRRIRLRMKH